MVNSKKLIGNRISDAIDEVSYKPMSLQPGSTILALEFLEQFWGTLLKLQRPKEADNGGLN
jgi:hypothetical protein